MNIVFKSPHSLKLTRLLAVVALTVAACSTNVSTHSEEQPAFQATNTLSRPTRTPFIQLTATSELRATIRTTATPSADVDLRTVEIESSYSNNYVVTAFWSDEGRLVYYAFASFRGEKPLKWAAYDIATRSTTNISSPLKFDNHIWQRLNVPEPLADLALYPELLGYMSPSGKHVIFTVTRSDPSVVGPDPNARTEIWIADSDGQRKIKLLELFPGIISQAIWFEDETKVIFDFDSEGGGRLYVADVENGTVVSLADISGFKGGTEERWAVSSDGTSLAVIDFQGMLWLISLEDGKSMPIEKITRNPSWSNDGEFLYYWWGSSYNDTYTLHSYDLTSGSVSTLVSQSELAAAFDALPGSEFAISPSGDKIVFWGGWLWLVELRK